MLHRAAALVFSTGLALVPALAVAQVQPGSTGGTIGKQDKTISGEDQSAPPAQRPKRSARTRDEDRKPSANNGGTVG